VSLRSSLEQILGEDQVAEAAAGTCWACGADGLEGFYVADGIPTQTCVLLDTVDEARSYPTGDLLLGFCQRCGFIQNVRFDPTLVDYSKPTEESQAYSHAFQVFAATLAKELFERFELAGKTVLEVGCGKGDFLAVLAGLGIGRGIGIDPGFLPERADPESRRLEFIRDWYDPRYAHLTGDLVLTRHLLEHVNEVGDFTRLLRTSTEATAGAALFVEVPDVRRVLEERAFWDVYYEHCSYFTLGSLGRMLRRLEFDIRSLRTAFGDQYLLTEATIGSVGRPHPAEETTEALVPVILGFAASARAAVNVWRRQMTDWMRSGQTLALWGGGSKAVAFLTTLGLQDADVAVVDINPHKQGKYLPGTCHRVVGPQALTQIDPGVVVVMNPIYVDEIRADLQRLGLRPELRSVSQPVHSL
jgi:SAM-dependent methyltransferase